MTLQFSCGFAIHTKTGSMCLVIRFLFWFIKKNGVVFTSFFYGFFQFKCGFYNFWTVNEFPLRSRGGNNSSEFSQSNIFSNNSRVTPCFKILALLSPRVRIPTRSRLSPIFLWSFGEIPNCFCASMKGNPFLSIKKSIKFDLFMPSIASFLIGFSISNFGINCQSLKNAETTVSKNQNKFTNNNQ